MSALINAVNLYRLLGSPGLSLTSTTCSALSVELSEDIIQEIITIWQSPDGGSFPVEVTIGLDTYDDESYSRELGLLVGRVATKVKVKFQRKTCYSNIQDFIQRCNSLSNGIVPELIFISELDYLRGEANRNKPEDMIKVEHFCKLISCITKVCHFVDNHDESNTKAVFIVNNDEDKVTRPVFVDLAFDSGLLECSLVDFAFVDEIIELNNSSTHKEEKLSTLRLAIWETLSLESSTGCSVLSLVKSWEELSKKYHASYELYIRGFSFSKFQNDVHEYLIDNANKANELLGGVANKIVIVPSLFGGWLLAMKQEDPELMLSLGLVVIALFAVIIVVYVLENQNYMLSKLKQNSIEKFNLFRKKAHANLSVSGRKDFIVDSFIESTNKEFLARLEVVRVRLILIRVLIWLFLLAMFIGFCIEFWQYDTPFDSVLTLTVLLIIILGCGISIFSKEKDSLYTYLQNSK